MPPRPSPRKHLVLTLDAFSTLYTPRSPIPTQYLSLARSCNLPLPEKSPALESQLTQSFRTAFKAMYARSPNYGRATGMKAEEWWDAIVRDTITPLLLPPPSSSSPSTSTSTSAAEEETSSRLSQLSRSLYTHFSTSAAYTLFPDAQNLISRLRTLRSQTKPHETPQVIVGILSNSDSRVTPVLQSLGLTLNNDTTDPLLVRPSNDIDFVLTSYAAGSEKPDPAIFRAAESVAESLIRNTYRLHRPVEDHQDEPPPEIRHVHIGDDYHKDVLGARGVGWDVLFLQRREEEGLVSPPNKRERERREMEEEDVPVIERLDGEGVWDLLGGP